MQWVQDQQRFSVAKKVIFADTADGWIVAYARAKGSIVVTEEQPAPQSSKIKIPDVCAAFGVQYVNTFVMLRSLGMRLVRTDTALGETGVTDSDVV